MPKFYILLNGINAKGETIGDAFPIECETTIEDVREVIFANDSMMILSKHEIAGRIIKGPRPESEPAE